MTETETLIIKTIATAEARCPGQTWVIKSNRNDIGQAKVHAATFEKLVAAGQLKVAESRGRWYRVEVPAKKELSLAVKIANGLA